MQRGSTEAMASFTYILCAAIILCGTLVEGKDPRTYLNPVVNTVSTSARPGIDITSVPLVIYDRNGFVFQVQACSDAILMLQEYKGSAESRKIEVRIGGWQNTRSSVWLHPTSGIAELIMAVMTPAITSCTEMRNFWLSWRHNKVELGRGPMYGQQTVFQHLWPEEDYFYDITALTLTSGQDNSAVWKFSQNQAERMMVDVPPRYTFGTLWKSTPVQMRSFISFQVRACAGVRMALSETIGVLRRQAFEVVIGGQNNTKSMIRWSLGGPANDRQVERIGLLDCDNFRPFWVSWMSSVISFGQGVIFNEKLILKSEIPEDRIRPIGGIGFSTHEGREGTFIFGENQDPAFMIYSPEDTDFKIVHVTFPRANKLRFEVKACSAARIHLSSEESPYNKIDVQITISDKAQGTTYIADNGIVVAQVMSQRDLDCDMFQTYTVAWTNGRIQLYYGGDLYHQPIIEWQSPYPRINSAAFGNLDTESEWKLKSDRVDSLRIFSERDYDRERTFIWVDEELMKIFSVRACAAVYITLTNGRNRIVTRTIEVILGDNNNKNTVIWPARRNRPPLANVSTPDVLSCSEYRWFWVTWINHEVVVGRGWRHGDGILASAAMESNMLYAIQAISVSASGGDAWWRFDGENGDYVMRYTNGNRNNVEWLQPRSDLGWISFRVHSCASIAVLLSEKYNVGSSAYEIGLQWNAGSRTYIRKRGVDQTVQQFVAGKLSCDDPRDFWIQWEGGEITLGEGSIRDLRQIISWTDPQPSNVTGVGILSGEDVTARWRFWANDLVESRVALPPDSGPGWFWTSTLEQVSAVVGVRTCGEFQVLLSAMPFNTNPDDCYILSFSNSMSQIRTGGRVKVTADTPYLLSCDEERLAWISWHGGVIMAGRGNQVGVDMFMDFQDLDAIEVGGLGISNNNSVSATFRILHDNEGTLNQIIQPNSQSQGLGNGEIAGIVIGAILLVALACGAFYIIFRPPEKIKSFLYPGPEKPREEKTAGFSNILNTEHETAVHFT